MGVSDTESEASSLIHTHHPSRSGNVFKSSFLMVLIALSPSIANAAIILL
jgi:hypothetical protein